MGPVQAYKYGFLYRNRSRGYCTDIKVQALIQVNKYKLLYIYNSSSSCTSSKIQGAYTEKILALLVQRYYLILRFRNIGWPADA